MSEDEQRVRPYFKRDSWGRYEVWPDPRAIAFGRSLRRARLMAGLSQRRLAALSGVSQAVISRFERGLAPGISSERLIRLCDELLPFMPFGFCPHEHSCPWPRIAPVDYVRAGDTSGASQPPVTQRTVRTTEIYQRLVRRLGVVSRPDGPSLVELVEQVVAEVDAELATSTEQ